MTRLAQSSPSTRTTGTAAAARRRYANVRVDGISVTTSYWSSQAIQVLNADGTLYVPSV